MPPTSKFILIGEDDLDDQEILQEIFSKMDNSVPLVFVNNGNGVLDLLNTLEADHLPNLIVLDYNMPGMNAAEILRELMNYPGYRDIPRIIWSTSTSETFKKTCLELGATDYVVKPSNINELTEIANYMLSFCKS